MAFFLRSAKQSSVKSGPCTNNKDWHYKFGSTRIDTFRKKIFRRIRPEGSDGPWNVYRPKRM